jgi:hypothetical protein
MLYLIGGGYKMQNSKNLQKSNFAFVDLELKSVLKQLKF